jgi:hypothetical protein
MDQFANCIPKFHRIFLLRIYWKRPSVFIGQTLPEVHTTECTIGGKNLSIHANFSTRRGNQATIISSLKTSFMRTMYNLVTGFFKKEWFLLITMAAIVAIFVLFEMAL